MYLSHLLIDVGSNPDRPRPGRQWLRNIYHVHQRLSMAFPTDTQRVDDPHFLRPYNPAGFKQARFLFRIDNSIEQNTPRAVLLVQSQSEPDWEYAFHNARVFLAAPPETRTYRPEFPAGADCRFRVRMNLSKKSTVHRKETGGTDSKGRPRDQGKRVGLTWNENQSPEEAVQEWFAKKATSCGFALRDFNSARLGWVTGYKPKRHAAPDEPSSRQLKFRSALIEGALNITDPARFSTALATGIGSAKAFGFGLLSVARM